MRSSEMRVPALQQIYNQRYQYEQHKRMLMKIYTHKKPKPNPNQDVVHFDQIRQSKVKSFVNKINKQNANVSQQNMKLFQKLESIKSSIRKQNKDEGINRSFVTPFMKKRISQTEKQNIRMSNKIKSLSSHLNQKKFIRDYTKSQQIKTRIMKYATEESGVYLKSNRYLNEHQQSRSSVLFKSKVEYPVQNGQSQLYEEGKKSKNLLKRSAASHYKASQIRKNRVEEGSLFGGNFKYRSNTSLLSKKTRLFSENDREQNFFPTQPKKSPLQRKFPNRFN